MLSGEWGQAEKVTECPTERSWFGDSALLRLDKCRQRWLISSVIYLNSPILLYFVLSLSECMKIFCKAISHKKHKDSLWGSMHLKVKNKSTWAFRTMKERKHKRKRHKSLRWGGSVGWASCISMATRAVRSALHRGCCGFVCSGMPRSGHGPGGGWGGRLARRLSWGSVQVGSAFLLSVQAHVTVVIICSWLVWCFA